MARTPKPRTDDPANPPRSGDKRQAPEEPVPTWRNTRPRGNPETDTKDLERSRERFEAVLGR
jgi:hypothetical protein